MRTKLTIAAALAAVLATAVAAHAGPVTVALYRFQVLGDVQSFYKVEGPKCHSKWRKESTLGVIVGRGTNACALRSSVVADVQDPGPDQEMAATTNLAASTPENLRNKIYLGVAVRQSDTTAYELRVFPSARKWQLLRDARGANAPALLGSGLAKFIRQGVGVRNDLLLRAFDYGGSSVLVLAKINGKKVLSITDTSAGAPNGRRTTVVIGAKGKASANRAVGAFDNVAIRVPDPFN
jgi:hypothetical protein